MNPNEKMPKKCQKFICEKCTFICSKKSNYDKHLTTLKHKILTNPNEKMPKPSHTMFACGNCKKLYKHSSSLSNHKKVCVVINEEPNEFIVDGSENEVKSLTTIILELVKSNNDLQKQVLEICKNNNTIINTNTNSNNTTNNKTFNLHFFLNEECKDAMNMSEFINSIQLKLSDLENIGKVGYVEGMSNIIIKKLNDTDIYKRPVHCSDAKREILYVKEENKWEKEGPENSKMMKAVYGMNKKNYLMLNVWKDAHPNCLDGQTKQCDDYMKIMSKVMDGDKENINKVIKKVAKQVLIDK